MTTTTRTFDGTTYELHQEVGTLEAAKRNAAALRSEGWRARTTVDQNGAYVWRAARPATDEQVAEVIRQVVGTESINSSLLTGAVTQFFAREVDHLTVTPDQIERVALQIGRVAQPHGYSVVAHG